MSKITGKSDQAAALGKGGASVDTHEGDPASQSSSPVVAHPFGAGHGPVADGEHGVTVDFLKAAHAAAKTAGLPDVGPDIDALVSPPNTAAVAQSVTGSREDAIAAFLARKSKLLAAAVPEPENPLVSIGASQVDVDLAGLADMSPDQARVAVEHLAYHLGSGKAVWVVSLGTAQDEATLKDLNNSKRLTLRQLLRQQAATQLTHADTGKEGYEPGRGARERFNLTVPATKTGYDRNR